MRTIAKEIQDLKAKLDQLIKERNELIRGLYTEMYNVSTWNKTKVGYVYVFIGKEFGLNENTVKNIIMATKND
jgi:hypothetical protein